MAAARSSKSSFSILVGLARFVAKRFGLGRHPATKLSNAAISAPYIPLTTSLIVSVALSVMFWFFSR